MYNPQQPTNPPVWKYNSFSSSLQNLPLMQQFTSFDTEQQVTPTQLHQIRARMVMNSNQAQMQRIQTLVQWNRLKERQQQQQQQQQQQLNIRATSFTHLHLFDQNMLADMNSGFGSQSSLQSKPSYHAQPGTSYTANSFDFPYTQSNGVPGRSASATNLVSASTGRSPSPAQFARMDRNAISPSYERWVRLQMNSPSPRPSSNMMIRRPEPVQQLSRRHLSLNDVRRGPATTNRIDLNENSNHSRRSAGQDSYRKLSELKINFHNRKWI